VVIPDRADLPAIIKRLRALGYHHEGDLGVPGRDRVNEREPCRSGPVYNTMLILGPDGLLQTHRKLMPTGYERSWHAFGSGKDLGVVALPFGRVGGLICWENRMPVALSRLSRASADLGGPDGGQLPRVAHPDGAIAVESGAFVVSVRSFQPHSAFPIADLDLTVGARQKRWFDVAGHYSREDVLLPRLTGTI
jgi:nitrilase